MTPPPPATEHDDGLVHSHDWARTAPPGSRHDLARAHGMQPMQAPGYDEGLVHEHGWARG